MTQATTLYQWPPALGTESIYPRCVVFQRICNIAHQPVKVVNVKLPRAGENFTRELMERLIGLPILKVGEERYSTSHQIVNFLLHNPPAKETKSKLTRLASAYSYITQQWANESFINTLVHARWKQEENFQRFVRNVQWGDELANMHDEVASLRQEILKYLRRTPIGSFDDAEFEAMFKGQFWALEHILGSQTFFEPMVKHPTLTDLYVFMSVQGLLSPDLAQSEWIQAECPNVMRWFHEVDQLTK